MVKFTIIWLDKESREGGKYTCRVKARHFIPMFRSGRRRPRTRRLFRHFEESTCVPTAVPTLSGIHARHDGVQSSP